MKSSSRETRESGRELHPLYRERLFAVINDAPFVRHMAMRITAIAWGSASFELEAAPFRMQPFNVIHGGNVATLIDATAFWACYLPMGSDDDGLTSVDLKLNYLAPAGLEALSCMGSMIKEGKTLYYAEAEVRANDGRLIAHGTSTLMRLPGHGMKLGIPLWDVSSRP